MSPLSSPTLTRLDPEVPLLWRDDSTLQFGEAGDVRVTVTAAWVELLLGRMRSGFRRSAFDVVAHGVGAPRREARMLLAQLDSFLVDDAPPPRAAWVETLNITDGRAAHRMREALTDEGIASGNRSSPDDVAVVLVQGSAAAVQFARYLRDDTPHLPVAFERGAVTVGPLIRPGSSPCLACRDGHERDRDDAWPRLHAQLIDRDAGPLRAAMVAEAAALVAALLRVDADAGAVVRLSADGSRAWRAVTFHAECRCRALSCPSQPGSGTEPVLLVPRTATSSEPGFALRA
ncbi:hypothetical protein FB560_2361 [Microbacterium saperdae]|uniref:Bacteriocin biosynthesis cyclodehydratase domain-containing protein n=1 Tax=Microbacterium saperdae TaxID=69368 RepID=A0A543BPD6_9MICO|nr:hypothetical protein FB560_2361 [Microbacterium saperdae]